MKTRLAGLLMALSLCTTTFAQSTASALSAASLLPMASMASAVGLVSGAVLVVRAVEVGARGTVYVLERASDGARFSVEVVGSSAAAASTAVGTSVTVTVLGSGVLLSTAAQVLAFIPNALGEALLHNERVAN